MNSRIANQTRQDQIRQARRMTPVERLQAFANHCRLMFAFHKAGEDRRARQTRAGSRSAS